MGADAAVVLGGATYTGVMLGGSVTVLLLFVVNAVFRSVGDAAFAMRALWLANVVNMALAPCLIFGVGPIPAMGVTGAAIATTASRALGVGYQLVVLARRRGHLAIVRRHLTVRLKVIGELLRLATPATAQVLVETASWLALVRIVSTYGSAALAGYTVAMRLAVFALLPSWGLAQSAATLVGQNLGAKSPERARSAVFTIAGYNLALLVPVGILFVVVPHALVGFFSVDPLVAAYGAECLRIIAVGFLVFAFGMVAVQAFNGAGDTMTPMLINLGAFWLFKIPCALVLSKVLGMGPRGAFLAITAAYTVQSVTAGLLFRRGRWQAREV